MQEDLKTFQKEINKIEGWECKPDYNQEKETREHADFLIKNIELADFYTRYKLAGKTKTTEFTDATDTYLVVFVFCCLCLWLSIASIVIKIDQFAFVAERGILEWDWLEILSFIAFFNQIAGMSDTEAEYMFGAYFFIFANEDGTLVML